jgi:FHS family L-fucose permease-like MFS transporter
MIVVGAGCGILEIPISTFVVLIEPQSYAEVRLNIFQGVQAVGALVPLLMESTTFYASVDTLDFSTLNDVQWVFLGCGFASFILAGIICCVHLPELRDPEPRWRESSKVLFCNPYGPGFILALWTLFLYAGGQEITRIYSRDYLVLGLHASDELGLRLEKSSQALFAAGRFISAFLLLLFRPRWLLLIFVGGLAVTAALAITHSLPQGVAIFALNLFFQSLAYPTTFTLAVRSLGSVTKIAAMYLVASFAVGGVVIPAAFYPVFHKHGAVYAAVIMVVCFGLMIVYPLYLNLVPAERERTKSVNGLPSNGSRPTTSQDGNSSSHEGARIPGIFFAGRRKGSANVIGIRQGDSRRGSGVSESRI